jgi:ADP-ribose pyrophosphatase YjhB (NUDIX family)
MVSVGPDNCGVVDLSLESPHASDITLVLQREPRSGKSWCVADIVLPKEKYVDAAVRDLFEEIGLTLTVDNFTVLSGVAVQVPLGTCIQPPFMCLASRLTSHAS